MKVRRQMERVEPMILNPVRRLEGEEWHRAPDGKWSIAQIVEHMAKLTDLVATQFEKRAEHGKMERTCTPKQSLARHVVLGLGKPPRTRTIPSSVEPDERPDTELVKAQFRMGVNRLLHLVATWPLERQVDIFVRHVSLGDLNLPEWGRFLYVHGRHQSHRIRVRLRWLRRVERKSA